MEALIRWSPHSTANNKQFVLLDVAASRLRLCSLENIDKDPVDFKVISTKSKLPSFTAFDFSRTNPYLVGLGGQSGEATILNIDPDKNEPLRTLPIKSQRRCMSIAFNTSDQVAIGLDKARADHGICIYDLRSTLSSPHEGPRKLALADGVTSVRFFSHQPHLLLAGVAKQGSIRLYDLRDTNQSNTIQVQTRLVHNLAIDPLDEHYFVSAGPEKDPTVAVWDRRFLKQGVVTSFHDPGPPGPVMEIKAPVDNQNTCSVNGLRFSGVKKGCFSILSSSGEVRAYELAQNSIKPDLRNPPHNPLGGTPWLFNTFVRRTHTLSHPIWSSLHPKDDKQRIISCDFISTPHVTPHTSILALSQNGNVRRIKIHDVPRKVNITNLDEIWLWKDKPKVVQPPDRPGAVLQTLHAIQKKAVSSGLRRSSDQAMQASTSRLENLSLESSLSRTPSSYESPHYLSSSGRHDDLLALNFPHYVPSLSDAMSLLPVQKRRCLEGYSLDAVKNQRIVMNDPWLVDMWGTVKRFEDHSKEDGMFYGGLELSYLGVHALWTKEFGLRNRITGKDTISVDDVEKAIVDITERKFPNKRFQGHTTKYPATRQLCLAMCGWVFTREALQPKCQNLVQNGEVYKAIVVAVMRGFKDLAQDLLRSAVQSKKIQNIGLGAVIACETVNDEQRQMCEWMAEETEDPYLKALLAYFVSGDWRDVAEMQILPLSDRLGVAVKYLSDQDLTTFIKIQTRIATLAGNIEGLVLTGLTERALDLFRNYLAKHNDLPTAVLALSFACPLYVDDARFDMWRETYLFGMQAWRAFQPRLLYIKHHNRLATSRSGRRFAEVPSKPVSIRCNHCLGSLAPHILRNDASGAVVSEDVPLSGRGSNAAARSGLVCPHCSRPMPHCGVCGLLMAGPDPRRMGEAAQKLLEKEDALARQAVYCMTCGHVFHGHHSRDWFARHKVCPVVDCQCMCGLLH